MNGESVDGLALRPSVLALFLSAAASVGAGSMAALGPQMQSAEISACLNDSEDAMRIALSNADEIQDLRRDLNRAGTDRFTGEDALAMRRTFDEYNRLTERRIELLERQIGERAAAPR